MQQFVPQQKGDVVDPQLQIAVNQEENLLSLRVSELIDGEEIIEPQLALLKHIEVSFELSLVPVDFVEVDALLAVVEVKAVFLQRAEIDEFPLDFDLLEQGKVGLAEYLDDSVFEEQQKKHHLLQVQEAVFLLDLGKLLKAGDFIVFVDLVDHDSVLLDQDEVRVLERVHLLNRLEKASPKGSEEDVVQDNQLSSIVDQMNPEQRNAFKELDRKLVD